MWASRPTGNGGTTRDEERILTLAPSATRGHPAGRVARNVAERAEVPLCNTLALRAGSLSFLVQHLAVFDGAQDLDFTQGGGVDLPRVAVEPNQIRPHAGG